jgi:predicted acetyltransferase
MEVMLANAENLDGVAKLFDQYRMFCQQPTDLGAARTFIWERFQGNDSRLFVAIERTQVIGFTQLYPSFYSVSMKSIWILNDLFVAENYRQQGVAR